MTDFNPDRFLDEGEAELAQGKSPMSFQAPQSGNMPGSQLTKPTESVQFDADAFLDQGEQELKSQGPPATPGAVADGPPMLQQPTPTQSGPKQWDLGAAVSNMGLGPGVGKVVAPMIQEFPLVKEVKNNPKAKPVNMAGNALAGMPYGLLQVGDIAGMVNNPIQGVAKLAALQDPKMQQEYENAMGPISMAKHYKDAIQSRLGEDYLPETFKAGGFLGQLALPGGIGMQAKNLPQAIGMGAIENAISGGISNAGEQLAEKNQIDPLDLAIATSISALFGGGLAGATHAGSNISKAIRAKSQAPAEQTVQPMKSRDILSKMGMNPADTELPPPLPSSMVPEELALPGQEINLSAPVAEPTKGADLIANLSKSKRAMNRRYMQGNTGEAMTVRFPSELEATMADYGGMIRRQRSGSNKAQFNVSRQKLEEMRAFLESNGVSPLEAEEYANNLRGEVSRSYQQSGEGVHNAPVHQKQPTSPASPFDLINNLAPKKTPPPLPAQALQRETKSTPTKNAVEEGARLIDGARHLQGEALDRSRILDMKDRANAIKAEREAMVAFALDKGDEGTRHSISPFLAAGPWAKLAAGVALFNHFAPKVAKQIDEGEIGVRVGDKLIGVKTSILRALFTDTVEKIKALDDVLETNVEKSIWDNLGRVHMMSWGVKIDQDVRFEAMDLLRRGKVKLADVERFIDADDPIEMPKSLKGTVFEGMDKVQMGALYAYQKAQNEIKRIVEDQIDTIQTAREIAKLDGEDLQGALESLPENLRTKVEKLSDMLDSHYLTQAEDALKSVRDSLQGREIGDLEKAYKAGLSKFMDYHFFFNPQFHITNLSDLLISGVPRVGPVNMMRSIHLLGPEALGGDKELKQLFESSNLTGSFEQERLNTAVDAGTKKGKGLTDLQSDKINADRTALGAMLQYASSTARANGYQGSDVDFVKDLLKGRLPAEIAVDCFGHNAETLSRTMGVDPLRINGDFLTSHPVFKYFSVFGKQPGRLANLQMHYLRNRDMKRFYWTLGMTAAVAGTAAIPLDAGYVWQNTDAESYFLASAILNKVEVLQYFTGKTMAPKVQAAIFYPVMGSSNPLREGVAQILETAAKAWPQIPQIVDDVKNQGAQAIDRQKVWSFLSQVLSLTKPRIKGLPAKQLVSFGREADAAFFEKMLPVYYVDQFGQSYGRKEEPSLDELGVNPVGHMVQNVLPGETSSIAQKKMAKLEEVRRGKNFFNIFGSQETADPYFKQEDAFQGDAINSVFRQFGLLGGAKK